MIFPEEFAVQVSEKGGELSVGGLEGGGAVFMWQANMLFTSVSD